MLVVSFEESDGCWGRVERMARSRGERRVLRVWRVEVRVWGVMSPGRVGRSGSGR